MKKVVVASLLAVASMACVARTAEAQTQVNLGSNAQATSGGVQMSPAEYNAYNSAIGQATPQTKAPALEAYLTIAPSIRRRAWMQPIVCCRSIPTTCGGLPLRRTSA
jgi:hypothetical protein